MATPLRAILFCCLIFYLSQYPKVEGGNRKISVNENLLIEKEIMVANMTSKTQYGDEHDCVDFYKQPAFNNPLLKNQTYHNMMRPNFFPIDKETTAGESLELELPGDGCPIGTVPIRRTSTKEDLLMAKLFKRTASGSIYRSVLRTKVVPNKKYSGGSGVMTIYRPSIQDSQYSSALFSVGNGVDKIEVGWTVNRILFGDDDPRFYVRTTTSTIDCYNSCSGFILVGREIPFGYKHRYSSRGGPIVVTEYFITREPATGRWWLTLGIYLVGYWPPEIFSDLKDLASYVEWGGEANTLTGYAGPGMTTGQFPVGNPMLDGFCGNMTILDENHAVLVPDNIETINDNDQYYKAVDVGLGQKSLGRAFLFGGPGPSI